MIGYLMKREYKSNRIKAIIECDGVCADCGRPYKHVHHIDGSKTNHAVSNLVPLCVRCHKHRHSWLKGKTSIDRTFYISKETDKQLRIACVHRGMTQKDFMKQAIEAYLGKVEGK